MRIAYFLLLVFFYQLSFAGTFDARKNRIDFETAQFRINAISSEIDLPLTFETGRLLDIYTYSYRPGARKIMEKGKIYFPVYEHKLSRMGLPDVLKNLTIVESNMDPWSFSSRGAVGAWQIMRYTARAHGLVMDRYVDERFDPVLAGQVAFTYLKSLHVEFGDWNLALIAYNCGPTLLRKAIKQCNSRDLDVLKIALPRESIKYASRFAAASYLSNYYDEHNIRPRTRRYNSHLASINVYDYLTFNQIANITGLTRQEIVELNPAVLHDFLPTNNIGYTLNLPLKEMIRLSVSKGWSLKDIHDLDFHLDELEARLSYTYNRPSLGDFNSDAKGEKDKDETEDHFFTFRREQVMRLLALS